MEVKIALVTGGSGALGKEICNGLRAHGFRVESPDRSQLDIGDSYSISSYASSFKSRFEKLDVLVNNAAILSDDMEASIRTNALGPFRLTNCLYSHLYGGRVVNVSSREGLAASFGNRAYSASKMTLNALTRVLASNSLHVRVNACCPGWFKSRLGGQNAPNEPWEAADTPLWLAVLAPDDFNGKFVIGRKEVNW